MAGAGKFRGAVINAGGDGAQASKRLGEGGGPIRRAQGVRLIGLTVRVKKRAGG